MRPGLLVVLLLASLPTAADERILSYHSGIQVHADGSQAVTETIRVRAEGKQIQRGIYRDFPTDYRTPNGSLHKVDFQLVRVERDGAAEAFHTQRLSNGVRVYVGRGDVLLDPGEYRYTLHYLTSRQLGFFEAHDELYWNVTGNGWDFPIEVASAEVRLPGSVPAARITALAYTGPQGATATDYRGAATDGGATFTTTRALEPNEGLTIVVGWPKGVVHEPTREDRLRWLWQDDPALVIVWAGVLLLAAYYLLAWSRVGRDPVEGVIVPEYEPPQGYPPAALRLVRRMGYDDKTLSAALVGLAVKGALKISEDDEEYVVTPTGATVDGLSAGEKAILATLANAPLEFKPANHAQVRALRQAHRGQLESIYERSHFYSNIGWLVPGWVLTVGTVAFAAISFLDSYGPQAVFTIFLSAFLAGFGAPFVRALWQLRDASARSPSGWVRLVAAGLPLGFVITFFQIGFLTELDVIHWALLLGVALIVLLNLLFHYLIKAPTQLGRKVLDHAQGFRQYLGIAESDELKFKYARPITPETFEAFLPYAIALDVETQWSERFAATLRASGQSPSNYRTSWYHGNSFTGVGGLSSSCGSGLASTVSSSSHAPGSSSGGGGGGSSGGGGGGGGGGGW